MKIPGFSATAALGKSDRAYRTGFSQPMSINNASVQPAAIVGGGRPPCNGCWLCWGPFPFEYCVCLSPCPIPIKHHVLQ